MEFEGKNDRAYMNVFKWTIPVLLLCLSVAMILFTSSFQNSAFKVKSLFTGSIVSVITTPDGVQKLETRSQKNINSQSNRNSIN